mmetsp:Transcript_8257/g.16781  ORF Transcript_8257/g.16781 Transcript_8257/m.16781 type:complete len:92 (+) Transcript_8257:200-475(+)
MPVDIYSSHACKCNEDERVCTSSIFTKTEMPESNATIVNALSPNQNLVHHNFHRRLKEIRPSLPLPTFGNNSLPYRSTPLQTSHYLLSHEN